MLAVMEGTDEHNPDAVDDAIYPRPMDSPQGSLAKIIVYGLGAVALIMMMAAGIISVTSTEEIIGIALISLGAFELVVSLIRYNELRYLVPSAMAIAAGAVLLFWPDETLRVAGLTLGALIVAHGFLDIWAGLRRWHAAGTNSWVLIRGFIGLVFGSLVLLFPSQLVELIIIAAATIAILRAVITVWFVVANRGADATIRPSDTSGIITYWLTIRDLNPDEVSHLENTVFLFRGKRGSRLWRFAVFMSLATAIATFGIATDSTAVVIGAMLIAPLMAPILGVSAGLINGRLRSAMWSGLIATGGILGVVALSWLLSAVVPNLQAVIANSQVTSRTVPNLLDLIIAFAAGTAGAYGVSRIEVSDTLPGVAVSIALVPPLAVIGITLHAGDLTQAAGAALLFLTNLFSIVLMAGVVFLLVGYGEWDRLYQRKDRIRTSFALVALGAILIAVPLALTGQTILGTASDLRNATDAVDDWLGEDSPYRVNDLEVSGDTVNIQLIGPGTPPPPPSGDLSGKLAGEIGRPMTARVAWILEHVELVEIETG